MLENNGSTTVFETTTLFFNYSSTNWEKPTNSNSSIKALEHAVIGFLKDLPSECESIIIVGLICFFVTRRCCK